MLAGLTELKTLEIFWKDRERPIVKEFEVDIIVSIIIYAEKFTILIIKMPNSTSDIDNVVFDELLTAIRKRKNNNNLVIK